MTGTAGDSPQATAKEPIKRRSETGQNIKITIVVTSTRGGGNSMQTFDKDSSAAYIRYIEENCPNVDVFRKQIGNSGVYVLIADGNSLFDTSETHAFVAGYQKGYMKGKAYR